MVIELRYKSRTLWFVRPELTEIALSVSVRPNLGGRGSPGPGPHMARDEAESTGIAKTSRVSESGTGVNP